MVCAHVAIEIERTVADSPENSEWAPEGAFVVHFRIGKIAEAQAMPGRVEHVTSGTASAFLTMQELWSFMLGVLSQLQAPGTSQA
jgi:hypothetical protein